MPPRSMPGLGELQAAVMEYVWDHGEATVAQVVAHLGKQRPVAYTTALVAMQKLEKKGWLAHRQEGRAYVYRPRRGRGTPQAGMLSRMLDAAFGGDPKLLLAQLLDARPWSEEELAELRKMIETRRKEKRRG